MRRISSILTVLLLMVSLTCTAAREDTLHTTFVVNSDYIPTHVVQLSVGGGLHSMMHTISPYGGGIVGFDKGFGAGGQVQATYTYYIHKYVGITTGVGFDVITGNMHGAFGDTVLLYDNVNKMQYWLNTDYHDFHESEQLYRLNIPLAVTGRVNVTDHWSLRGTLGIGMNVIVGSHYRADGQLTTSADYPDYNLHIDPDLPQHGFSNYYMGGYQGKIDNTYPLNMYVFTDLGAHYQFTKRLGMYFGLYFDYSLFNSIRVQTDTQLNRNELVNYNMQTGQWQYAGIVNSKFTDAIHPLSFGVKVGISLTFLDPIKCNCEDW